MFSEEEVISQLLHNINDNKDKFSNSKQKKDGFIEKNCCTAAVKYNTIGNAYKDIINNLNVYLIKEEKNGLNKTNAYSRCSKTTQDGNIFCHLHCRMMKYNSEGLKIFEKDIIPKSSTDKTRWLATINDDFFENMGKRGAKKKNSDNNYVFSSDNNPILLILTHKNVKLLTHLTAYATKLLKTNGSSIQSVQNIEPISEKKVSDTKENKLENLISMMSSINEDSSNKSLTQENEPNNSSSDEEEDNSSDSDSDSDSNNDDDEGVSCIQIISNNNESLWYNQETNTIYKPDDENNGEEIGFLKEISEEYHTIVHENKLYTVLIEENHPQKGKIHCCVLTDTLFNVDLNFIGTRTKINDKKYNFNFTD